MIARVTQMIVLIKLMTLLVLLPMCAAHAQTTAKPDCQPACKLEMEQCLTDGKAFCKRMAVLQIYPTLADCERSYRHNECELRIGPCKPQCD